MNTRKLLAIYGRTPGLPISRLLDISVVKLTNRKRVQVPYAPLSVHFVAVRKCNLNCLTCNTRTLFNNKEDLNYQTFCKILKQLPPYTMRRITCEGLGEPLLNPELPDMFLYAKTKGFITHTFTNATLFNETNAVSLLRGLDEITISLDGATKETYEKIRRGAKFEDVIENIKLLVALKKKERAPTYLEINFTCNRLNYHEIPKIALLASELGVNRLRLNMLRELLLWKSTDEYKQRIHNELACSYSDIKKGIPNMQQIELVVHHPGPDFPGCSWPFRACYITDDGFVTPCCLCVDPEVKNFGNIFKTPLAKIWNNQQYQDFRSRFISNRPPEICTKCRTAIT